MVNFVRRANGGDLFFPLWRDHIFIIVAVFALFHLALHTFEDLKFSDLKSIFRVNPAWSFLALLSIWMIISAFITGLDYETVIGSEKSHTGLICSLVYNTFFVMALCMDREKHIRFWTGLFLAVGFIISALIIFDYFSFGSVRAFVVYNFFFYNFNHLSYYLLIVSVCAYTVFLLTENKYIRLASLLVFSAGTAALLLADTLGCYVAFAISFIFNAIVFSLTGKFKWKRFIAVLLVVCLVVLVLLFVPNVDHETAKELLQRNLNEFTGFFAAAQASEGVDESLGSGRMILWITALKATLEKPVFGNGLAEMRNLLYTASGGGNNTVHNEFLEYCSNQGIPALLFYVAFVLSVFIRGAKNRRSLTNMNIASLCVAFAYLVSSVFGVTIFYTAPYLFIFLAFGYYKAPDERSAPAEI